jgi:circadian clock protein KaiC
MTNHGVVRQSTGIAGLDEILDGGLVPHRTYLVRGGPGTGKTTIGLHFLVAGAKAGERTFMITLGQPEDQIRQDAQSMGLDISAVQMLDLSPSKDFFLEDESYDIFSPAEVERAPTTQTIIQAIQTHRPQRIMVDAITQLRYLSADAFQFHKQALSFLRFLTQGNDQPATVMFTSEASPEAPDDDLRFMCDAVINLEFNQHERTLQVSKYRGSEFQNGVHSLRLSHKGAEVFPLLRPRAYSRQFAPETLSSGVPELDELLHGGLERSTVTIITGPTGVGKSTLGMQFIKEAAGRGERSVIYSFEEEQENLLLRCDKVNLPARRMMERGMLAVVKVDPLQLTPNEFSRIVRQEVETQNATMVMIDSTMGYRQSFREADELHMSGEILALSRYLANMGVTTLLSNEVEYVTGDFRPTEVGISYLADNIIFMRYLEMDGQMHRVIGVLKKRLSDFEKTFRPFEITRYGIKVGPPMVNLRGILTGNPHLKVDS